MTRSLPGLLLAVVTGVTLSSCITITMPPDVSEHVVLVEPATAESVPRYEAYIRKWAPNENAFVAVQRLAQPAVDSRDWPAAVKVYEAWRASFPAMGGRFDEIVRILKAPVEGITMTNLGPGINTDKDEYCPMPSADGRRMYFTSDGRPDGRGGEDNYVSTLVDGVWQPAVNLGSPVNTRSNESINSISADENTLLLFGNYPGSLGSGDLFHSERTASGWGEVLSYPMPVNSTDFESDAILTADGQAMLFVSDRVHPAMVGGHHEKGEFFEGHFDGNPDIYVSMRTESGWSDPINLGPTINTRFSERTPFLHADGKTLYFCSDGHPGLGGGDMFVASRKREDSWTEWSTPVNLGKECNTAGNDWGYVIATSGDRAYIASSATPSQGGLDIFAIALPKALRPEQVVTLSGRVTDPQGRPLAVTIRWEDLATKRTIGELRSNPADGAYIIVLPYGRNIGYYAVAEGFYPASRNVNLKQAGRNSTVREDIVMVSIEDMLTKGTAVRINNLFFDTDKSDLKAESFPELDRLASLLTSQRGRTVEISGHTDSRGKPKYNQTLSEKRAAAVVARLVERGCDRSMLVARGYGSTKPIATNDTDEGRALNRRVEFRFIEK